MEKFISGSLSQQKAYTIAFVLTIKEVLAQDTQKKAKESSSFADILDQLVLAIKEPSADHLVLYIGMAIAMSFLGYFIYSALGGGKPKLFEKQLLLSDVVDTSSASVDKDSAFHKKLDQRGPYAREPTGILTRDSTIKLREQITEKSYLDFKDRRDALMNERISFMKTNKQQDYLKLVQKAANEYREVTQKVTESALSFLDITEQDYINSFKELLKEPTAAKLMENMEFDVREKYEPVLPLKSRDEVKKIYCEQLQMEAQCEIQMQQQAAQAKNPQQVQAIMITMKTQLQDTIYIKHGLKAIDIKRQVQHHDLENDTDVQQLRKANAQIKQSMTNAQQQAQHELKHEMDSILDEEFKKRYEVEVAKIGKVVGGPNGIIAFDQFYAIQEMIAKAVNELTFKRMADHKIKRRTFLQQAQEQKYQEAIGKFVNTQKVLHQNLSQVFVSLSQSDHNAYNASGQFYSKQEKFQKQMNELAMKIAIEYENKIGKIVDQSKCIDAIRKIEEAKITSIDNVQKAAKAGKIPQHAVPIILEVDKTRVMDKIFLEDGIENEDIGKTMRELKLQDNEEFKKVQAEIQEKFAKAQAQWASM